MQFHILLLYFIAGFLRICGYFVGLPVNSNGAVVGETKPKGCSQFKYIL
jgi:hypothetical protein